VLELVIAVATAAGGGGARDITSPSPTAEGGSSAVPAELTSARSSAQQLPRRSHTMMSPHSSDASAAEADWRCNLSALALAVAAKRLRDTSRTPPRRACTRSDRTPSRVWRRS